MNFWEPVEPRQDVRDYGVWKLLKKANAMDALRAMFPQGQCDAMNFVLFSTGGVHGSFRTIEDEEIKPGEGVSLQLIQPRLVLTRYGVAHPLTADDFAFLKKLRASSWQAMSSIGAP